MHRSSETAATLLQCDVAKSVAKGCPAVNISARACRRNTYVYGAPFQERNDRK